MTKYMKFYKIIIAIFICQFAGHIGSWITRSALPSWYLNLVKPSFTPASWVFAPIWTILYVLMGVALYYLWEKRKEKPVYSDITLVVFGLQLVLNATWTIVFFGINSIVGAFVVLVFLWLMILTTIILSFRISHKAAYLLIPYLLWVAFAGALNYSVMVLN